LGSIDFGCGTLTSGSSNWNSFVAKLDPSGGCLWSKVFKCPAYASAHGVAVDPSGNVLVTGVFEGSIAFGTTNLMGTTGHDTLFVAKLDTSGALTWATSVEATGNSDGTGVAADTLGGVIVAGYYSGSLAFGGSNFTSSDGGTSDSAFVAKLDPTSGAHVWGKSFGTTGKAGANGVAVDASGDVFVTGTFSPSINFGCSVHSTSGTAPFVVKLSSFDGTCLGSTAFTGAADAEPARIAVDPSGSVVVTGNFSGPGSINFGDNTTVVPAGGLNMFIARLMPNLACKWAQGFGSMSGGAQGTGIALDTEGGIYATAVLAGSVNFGGGPLAAANGGSIVIAHFFADGTYRWANAYGGSLPFAPGVAVDPFNHVIVAGAFENVIDLGCGPLVSAGSSDAFVAELVR
jgi:hypothetical protein